MKRELSASQSVVNRVVRLSAIIIFLVLNAEAVSAQQSDQGLKEQSDSSVQNKPWAPPPPPPDKFDWIQLTSGEWLKGELKRIYQKKVEFDSDKLDLQEFDFKDVKLIRCHRLQSVRFDGDIEVVGMLKVIDDKVIITVGQEEKEFERHQVVAIAPGTSKERDLWSGKVTLGLNIRQGNSDLVEYSSLANIKRRTSRSRFILDYIGSINRTEGIETANSQRVNGQYDVFKTRKYFWRPVFGEYFRDPFQNIAHRITLGTGLGYHLINTSKTKWDVTAGAAFQYSQSESVEAGQASDNRTPALVAGTTYETEITEKIDFNGSYSFQIVDEEAGTFTHHAVATLETELTKILDFDITFIWDRIRNPRPESDGTVPKQDDFRLLFGLGIDF